MIKIGIMMSAAGRILTKLAPLGELDNKELHFIATTLDEVTKVEMLEEGIRNSLLHYAKPELLHDAKAHIFRGHRMISDQAVARFCRDEGIDILYTDNISFLSIVSPDTTVLVML